MADLVTELAERGKSLQPDDRSRLVDLLLESLHEPSTLDVQSSWEAEIETRLTEYDRGQVHAVDAEEVFNKARKIAR